MTEPPTGGDPLGFQHLAKMSDAAASVCNNIINRVSSAIGIAYEDLMIVIRARRKAKADGLLAAADAQAESNRLMTVSHTLLKIESAAVLHQEHLAERANRRLLANSIRQQENIEAIAAEAIEHVAERAARAEIKPVKEEPSADWMEDFIDLCKNTTESNMRQLWGRVLAGEMEKPGSYSVRALFALKMLLPSEAELFRHASRLVFDGGWIYRGERSAVAAQFGLPFETYVILSSAGLVASESELGASSAIENGGAALLRYGPYMFIIESYENNMPTTPIWSLTAVGKELVQLVDFDPNWEYVKCFAADQRKAGTYLLPVFTPQGMPEPPDLTPPEVAPKTTDRRVNESKNESKRAKPRKRKTQ